MSRLQLHRLGDFVDPVSKWNPASQTANNAFTYIDISAVDQKTKTIESSQTLQVADAPSRARQIVHAQDALVSTVRPNLNAVASVPDELNGAIASTGFTVLRPTSGKLHHRYLHHLTRSNDFIDYLVSRATGASYPAVSDSIVKDALVYIPLFDEQRRIADILDKADAIRRKREQLYQLSVQLEHSLFLDVVGPNAEGYQTWKSEPTENLVKDSKRSMRTGPFGSDLRHSEFTDRGIAVLGIDNAVNNRFAWGERRYITPGKYEKLKRYTVFPGDVIVTIMGTTGRSAVVPEDIPLAITTKHLATITPDHSKIEPEFLSNAIHRHPAVLAQIAKSNKGAIMDGLNLGVIKTLQIPVPPRDTQRRYVSNLKKIRSMQARVLKKISESEALFASISQRAFRGEL